MVLDVSITFSTLRLKLDSRLQEIHVFVQKKVDTLDKLQFFIKGMSIIIVIIVIVIIIKICKKKLNMFMVPP